jgi:hypothetical protein
LSRSFRVRRSSEIADRVTGCFFSEEPTQR